MNRLFDLSAGGRLIAPLFLVLLFLHLLWALPAIRSASFPWNIARGTSEVSIDLEASFRMDPGHPGASATERDGGAAGHEARIDRLFGKGTVFGAKEGARVRSYLGSVLQAIERRKIYPLEEQRAHHEGTAKVLLVLRADGSIKVLESYRSSGSKALDTAALRAVKAAGPFAPFPAEVSARELPIVLDMEYSLRD